MPVRPGIALVVAGLALSACSDTPSRVSIAPNSLKLASDGLRAGDSGLEVGFGRAYDNAVKSVSQLAGEAPSGTETVPCNGQTVTAVSYSSGLVLFFDAWAFRGWRAEGPALSRYAVAPGETLLSSATGGYRAGLDCPVP